MKKTQETAMEYAERRLSMSHRQNGTENAAAKHKLEQCTAAYMRAKEARDRVLNKLKHK